MAQIFNTVCPYSTQPLSECAEVNAEHIVPYAFGAPKGFTVPADAAKNSLMNDLIDSPAANDPILRFFAMSHGVVSRSGPVSVKVQGTLDQTGDEIITTFSLDGVECYFPKPVDVNDSTGQVELVRGIGEQATRLANAIKAKYEKKGVNVELGEARTISKPLIKNSLEVNFPLVNQQLTKIAYLMTIRNFGDEAILGESGRMFREAMMAKNPEDLGNIGIRGGFQPLPEFVPRAQAKGHTMSCYRIGTHLVSAVSLFNIFHAVFITPATGVTAEEATGEIAFIEPATSTLTTKPYAQYLQEVAMAVFGPLGTSSR